MLVVAVAAFLWVGASTTFAFPACVLEDLSAWAAIRRSWSLTCGSRWRNIAVWLIILAGSLAFSGSLQWANSWALNLAWHAAHGHVYRPIFPILTWSVYLVYSILLGPIHSAAVTLLYYDQRIRKEAFDIEQLIQISGMAAPAEEPALEPVFAASILMRGPSIPVEESRA